MKMRRNIFDHFVAGKPTPARQRTRKGGPKRIPTVCDVPRQCAGAAVLTLVLPHNNLSKRCSDFPYRGGGFGSARLRLFEGCS